VGLRIVHAHFLDDLAVARSNGKPSTPAVFLSGNGPLVEVLQYELRGAGGGGKTFVRGVKDYVKTYSARPALIPPEHVLVFDEAQRAFDALQVQIKHATTPGFQGGKSEPEYFIEFAERIPQWCVVIGLIGSGQEIHVGEEAGLVQWRHAIERSHHSTEWEVHGPSSVHRAFQDRSKGSDRGSSHSARRIQVAYSWQHHLRHAAQIRRPLRPPVYGYSAFDKTHSARIRFAIYVTYSKNLVPDLCLKSGRLGPFWAVSGRGAKERRKKGPKSLEPVS